MGQRMPRLLPHYTHPFTCLSLDVSCLAVPHNIPKYTSIHASWQCSFHRVSRIYRLVRPSTPTNSPLEWPVAAAEIWLEGKADFNLVCMLMHGSRLDPTSKTPLRSRSGPTAMVISTSPEETPRRALLRCRDCNA